MCVHTCYTSYLFIFNEKYFLLFLHLSFKSYLCFFFFFFFFPFLITNLCSLYNRKFDVVCLLRKVPNIQSIKLIHFLVQSATYEEEIKRIILYLKINYCIVPNICTILLIIFFLTACSNCFI